MKKKVNAFQELHDLLFARYGVCACPLEHASDFQLLAATILSAQCKDERVNMVTRDLFKRYPDAPAMAQATVEEVKEMIRSVGLAESKAKSLVGSAKMIVERYGGNVPSSMEELTSLPGVGRKTANVILGNAFHLPGFPVDTHVRRILNRMKLLNEPDPAKIERIVCAKVPPELWTNYSHLLITFGRRVCDARKPDCEHCPAKTLCKAIPGLK